MSHQLLRKLLARPIAFHPALARLAGRVTAGLFLSQLLYWCERSSHEDGWVYKDANEWEEETTLSEDEQRGARKVLEKLGFIQVAYASKYFPERFTKFEKTFCYRIDFDRLFESLEHANESQSTVVIEGPKFPLRETKNPIPTQEHTTPRSENSGVGSQKIPVHTTESTPETTTTPTQQSSGGVDIEEMVKAALWTEEKAGRQIRTRGGWELNLRNRYAKGFSPADLADFAEYQRAITRTAENQQRTAIAHAPPKLDPAALAHGNALLKQIDKGRRARLSS